MSLPNMTTHFFTKPPSHSLFFFSLFSFPTSCSTSGITPGYTRMLLYTMFMVSLFILMLYPGHGYRGSGSNTAARQEFAAEFSLNSRKASSFWNGLRIKTGPKQHKGAEDFHFKLELLSVDSFVCSPCGFPLGSVGFICLPKRCMYSR